MALSSKRPAWLAALVAISGLFVGCEDDTVGVGRPPLRDGSTAELAVEDHRDGVWEMQISHASVAGYFEVRFEPPR